MEQEKVMGQRKRAMTESIGRNRRKSWVKGMPDIESI